MTSMVERVARAIYEAHPWGDEHSGPNTFDRMTEDWKAVHRTMARAAIEAMKEPTEQMTLAVEEWGDSEGYGAMTPRRAREIWVGMIDAALKE